MLRVVFRPGADVAVDLVDDLDAKLRRREPLLAFQVLATDDLEQPLPLNVVGAARVDVDVIVGAAGLAGENVRRCVGAEHDLVAHARARLLVQELRGVGDAAVIDHRVLHRDLDLLAAPRRRALVERRQHADAGMKSGAGIAERHAGLDRLAVALAGDTHDAAGRLRDHVEGEMLLVGAPLSEALDRRVDDARVDLRDFFIGEAELLDHARREVLCKDVRLGDQLAQHGLAALVLEIERYRALVGVEQHEIVAVDALLVGRGAAALLAADRVLDLDDVGAEPGECFSDRRSGLELREIDDLDAGERGALGFFPAWGRHGSSR